MTCIAGMITDETVSMGGDFLCSSLENGFKSIGKAKVIQPPKGQYAIGGAGSSRIDRYLHRYVKAYPTNHIKSIHDVYALTDYIESELESVVIQATDESDFPYYPFELMVASTHGLWVIDTDLSVTSVEPGDHNYAAIGHGAPVALGALEYLRHWGDSPGKLYPSLMSTVSKHNITVGEKSWHVKFV